jgi:uncharacterized protein RhaS with RHS repeats
VLIRATLGEYDPPVGCYVESDPIGHAGGSYSTYGYANGNPVSNIDQTGTQAAVAIPVAAAAAIAITCYATNACQGITQALTQALNQPSDETNTAAKSVAELLPKMPGYGDEV